MQNEDAVPVTINLKPEIEADLLSQAQGEGLSLDQFLSRKLEMIARISPSIAPPDPSNPANPDQWETGLDEWLDSFPQHPVLSEEALRRENWYSDRW
jgi:hypothetical protein